MQAQIKLENIDPATCVVKGTHKAKGRTNSVSPGATASRNLFYGRIIIEAGDAPIAFENGTHETGLGLSERNRQRHDARSDICDESLRRTVCAA